MLTFIKLILVGSIWGVTNPLIKIGSKGLDRVSKKSSRRTWILNTLLEFKFLLLNWKYMLPFLINQTGSVLYYFALQDSDLSLAVPIANSVTFISTALTGWLIGEETPDSRTCLGMLFILGGISCYILDKL
ncbi:transmembrane protein 234 homolog isoform X2 [Bemisia tabaci]